MATARGKGGKYIEYQERIQMKLIPDTLPGPISGDLGTLVAQLPFAQFFSHSRITTLNILLAAKVEHAQDTFTDFNAMMFTHTSMQPLFCSSTHAPDCCCCCL
jgi:hypothetical protein